MLVGKFPDKECERLRARPVAVHRAEMLLEPVSPFHVAFTA
jgi:hypothetical protein